MSTSARCCQVNQGICTARFFCVVINNYTVCMWMCCQLSLLHICRVSVVHAIALLCTRVKKFRAEWLLALPLRHFLSGRCQPFDKPEMDPEVLLKFWKKTVDELHLNELKSKAEAGYAEYQHCKTSLAHLLCFFIM